MEKEKDRDILVGQEDKAHPAVATTIDLTPIRVTEDQGYLFRRKLHRFVSDRKIY